MRRRDFLVATLLGIAAPRAAAQSASTVKRVSPCGVCMMGRFFVLSGLMMFSCLAVVTRGMRMMLCRLLMVLGCFLGHSGVSSVWWPVLL